jgi:uncharacterized protein
MRKLEFATIIKRLHNFSFPEVDLVVGIESGGIIPAALVSYHLGKSTVFMSLNYRDEHNQPRHKHPVLLKPFHSLGKIKSVLVVDDVSVSGETLKRAKELLKSYRVKTFVLKGEADYVLFPEIKDCVYWPWKKLMS